MNLNQELVKQGWCWWYRKYAPRRYGELERLEKEAREAKKGLWVDPRLRCRRGSGGREAVDPAKEVRMRPFSLLLFIALLAGCTGVGTSLVEVRATEPLQTGAFSMPYDHLAACVKARIKADP